MKQSLKNLIHKLPKKELTCIRGAKLILRNGDVHYPFRQDSDFLYLTGISAPNLILTLFGDEVILWRESLTEKERIWGSDKLTDDEMREISGIADIREIGELELYKKGKVSTTEEAVRHIIRTMRMIKTPDEIEKIQKAITITNRIYEDILHQIQSGMYEYEIEALIAYGFRKYHGTEAFPTIVASGPIACILHYTKHTRQLQREDLILLDFGIELDGYSADISRTFPVLGKFDTRQQEIYNAVLDVKQFAESMLKPGITRKIWNTQVKEYMYTICTCLSLEHIDTYTAETNPYFPHSIGHFLGLDTHDVGDSDISLKPGMILTIEPGIYIREEGIGIRIEDDYLLTEDGCKKL